MTVAELIEALKAMPQDAEVIVFDGRQEGWNTCTGVERREGPAASLFSFADVKTDGPFVSIEP